MVNNEEITITSNNVIVTLKRIPGKKTLPFSKECISYYIDKISGIGKEYDSIKVKVKKTLSEVVSYCMEERVAVTYTTEKLRIANLKAKDIDEISTEVGFYRSKSNYWYIP